jgi:hypothetical protein
VSDFVSFLSPYEKNKNAFFSPLLLKRVAKKRNTTKTRNNGEEATLGSAEEEEEKGERRGREGYGAVEAWSDEVVDRVGVASEGCVCLACDFEIEWDGSIFLFICQYREFGCA